MGDWKNQLYFGDNLGILRAGHIPPESIDLIYLDPPFNSNATYNVLYRDKGGAPSASQIVAFDDTWKWGEESESEYRRLVEEGTPELASLLQALRQFLGQGDMMAYITMMAPRLVELRRVLKPTGSIWLHCDPTASHYLKLLMDAVFGPAQFRNEISWRRTPFSGSSKARAMQFPRSHDSLLFYSRGVGWTWNQPVKPYSEDYRARFRFDDNDGRGPYRKSLLATYSQETFDRLKEDGRLVAPVHPGAKWSYKQYLSESSGTTQIDDIWTDINAINPVAKERRGYPTQKPEALLERIIRASSNEGDIVLDPFCGCGTAVIAAERLERKWIGIDVAYMAISLIKKRLDDSFGLKRREYVEEGTPKTAEDAIALAESGPHGRYQFQWCVIDRLSAQPVNDRRKGADRGVDGLISFFDDTSGVAKRILIQVKSGAVHRDAIATLKGDMKTHHATLGVLVTAQPPTKPMEQDAISEGFYASKVFGSKPVRSIQIITAADLFAGKTVEYYKLDSATFKKAPLAKTKQEEDRLL